MRAAVMLVGADARCGRGGAGVEFGAAVGRGLGT